MNGVNKKYLNNTKKGFTLIELLAVIVILAIIALIATPIILNMINNAKKSASIDSAYGYIEAIEFNNSMAQIDNKKYTLINDGTDIDVNTIGNIGIKGTKPESGKVSITKGRITKATLCINSYNVEYDGKEAKVKGKCNEEETNLETNDSLLGYVAKKTLKNNTYETIKIKDETYTAHVYNYNGNQTWTSNMTFGDSNDVATKDEYAKNMIIVKVNGDLTINEGVTVTAYASEEGYGGPKGLFIYVTGTLTNNGTISMIARGAKAEGQNVYLFKNSDGSYEYVPKEGAAKVLGKSGQNIGSSGISGIGRQTGGGGAGTALGTNPKKAGDGEAGTSYSGGSGGGGSYHTTSTGTYEGGNGASNGGSGGNGAIKADGDGGTGASGGAGNPAGIDAYLSSGNAIGNSSSSKLAEDGTGGLLIIYTDKFVNNGNIESKGSNVNSKKISTEKRHSGGGASGGGSINIFYKKALSIGNINVSGGISIMNSTGMTYSGKGGNGGAGTATIGTIVNDEFSNTLYNFEYTGDEQIFITPATGYYLLETWGAQGGTANSSYVGGYGGYSIGKIKLTKNDKLYINIGGKGTNGVNSTQLGGYNGGGIGQSAYSGAYYASGGGATHIATKSGLLSSLENSRDDILIVSGGGGGSWYQTSGYTILQKGGSGGGFKGGNADGTSNVTTHLLATGGTQTEGGSKGSYNSKPNIISGLFGKGGDREASCGSGGGSGYYGGGHSNCAAGAGGSGYIGNPLLKEKAMYCYNCEESKEEATKTISTTNVSESPISNYAKIGNGYARITYIAE